MHQQNSAVAKGPRAGIGFQQPTKGFTDNYCSNEVIVTGLTVAELWPLLNTPHLWPTYYANSANTRFHDGKGPELENGVRFYFETFGFPVEAQVVEHVAPFLDNPPA